MSSKTRRSAARIVVSVLIVAISTFGFASLSAAAPSRQEVERARARLEQLNRELSLLVERYNQARLRLEQVEAHLAEIRAEAARAEATSERAMQSLNRSAARAFQGVGSQITALFDSTSIADFSDRLEFIGSIAEADNDVAVEAEIARQEAQWTADELRAAIEEHRGVLEDLAAQRDQIEVRVDEARDLFETLDRRFQEALAAQRAAERAAAEAAAQEAAGDGGGGIGSGPPIPPPPAPNPAVGTVLEAAYSAIGTPYQWGGSSPETGFDCSGFTMWAWSHAGVFLPHSSAAQYAALPHVAREDLQAGDLLFFYSPISHVGMYVGGGRMIHASHPGVPVGVVAVYWDSFVGAARPG
jgi:cell wall-associated NlpC family hydrolase